MSNITTVNWTLYSKNQVIDICETQSRIVNKIAEAVINRRIPDTECRLRIVTLLQKLGVLSEAAPPPAEKPKLELVEAEEPAPEPEQEYRLLPCLECRGDTSHVLRDRMSRGDSGDEVVAWRCCGCGSIGAPAE